MTLLDAKASELLSALQRRGRIAWETSAEETEQMILKGEREFAMLAIDRDILTLREVRSAQARISQGIFGVCEECECEIPCRRLEAVPWARRCVACQEATDRTAAASTFRPLQFAA
jgi:DnaK suppressor protein